MAVKTGLQIRVAPCRRLCREIVPIAAVVAALCAPLFAPPGMAADDVAASAAAAPAQAEEAAPPTIVRVAEVEPPARPEKKIVCRAEIPTGSHISTNRCRSKAQVDREAKESQDMIDAVRRREAHRQP